MLGLVEGHFFTIGKMFATILVQGGAVMPLSSHAFLNFGRTGIIEANIKSIPDHRVRNMIEEVCGISLWVHLSI